MIELAHDHVHDLLGAYAADALDAPERLSVEAHLADCALCRAEVAAHREALSLLIPSSEPPAALWQAIEARLEEPTALAPLAPLAPVVHLHARRRRIAVGFAAAAALVAISVGVTVAVEHRGGLGSPTEAVPIVSHATPGVQGTVTLYRPSTARGVVVVALDRIAAPPAGHHYEVWVLRAGGGNGMEAIGSFSPTSGSARLELPLPGPGNYRALDISLQDDGGPAVHSNISVAGATF